MRHAFWIALAAPCITACSGPERGWWGEARGRSQALIDDDDAGRAPARRWSHTPLFPLLFAESSRDGFALEVLWPLLEIGRGAELAPGVSPRWLRVRPFLWHDEFRGLERTVAFPFYFRLRQSLAAGDRAIDHFWPIYGLHRQTIDLAPATSHHVAWPLFMVRHGAGRWRVRLLPLADGSSGYIDRGWWLLPALKWGGHGYSRFLYVLDPLFSFERDSIAADGAPELEGERRVRVRLLGGLLGWEDDRGRRSFQLLWWLRL